MTWRQMLMDLIYHIEDLACRIYELTEVIKEFRDGEESEKWRDAVYSIVDGLDDPYVGDEWKDASQEDCARELEHIRSVLVPLVRGEEER